MTPMSSITHKGGRSMNISGLRPRLTAIITAVLPVSAC